MTKRKQRLKVAGFISKLVEILKNKQNQELIQQESKSRSFKIKNIRKFTDIILPRYFKHKNYSSFIRQVNLYGFHKLPNEGKEQIYQHEFFNIESIKDLKKIKRKLMESEIRRKKQRQYSQCCESDSQYNCYDGSQGYTSQKELSKHYSSEKYRRDQMEIQIQEMERKKVMIQNKIEEQQKNKVRLQNQNNQLKGNVQEENLRFYADMLNILINIIVSRYQIEEIRGEDYEILIGYLLRRQKQLYEMQSVRREKQKRDNNKLEIDIGTLSELLCSQRFNFGEENDPNAINQFIKNLLVYVKNQQVLNEKEIHFNPAQFPQKQQRSPFQANNNYNFNEMYQVRNSNLQQEIKIQHPEQHFQSQEVKQDKSLKKNRKYFRKYFREQQDDEYLPSNK